MKKTNAKEGVFIKSVQKGSPFYRGGLRAGDTILAINGTAIRDELDFQYYCADYALSLKVVRNNKKLDLAVLRDDGSPSGVTLVETAIRRCANRCIFCFIDQMPKGLRQSLYIKDEDIRLSMLNGNYVTMSNFKKRDLDQIARIGLSPLYISVHATDTAVRRELLGHKKAPDIMEQLDFLAENDICFHTQIVVCPGYNDGKILQKTVNDLLIFSDALQSIAVVPVGITRFQKNRLTAVDQSAAKAVCKSVTTISDRAFKRDGFRKVFLADEFFIRAALPLPEANYYEQYPQLENGVGLVRQLLDSLYTKEASAIKSKLRRSKMALRRLVITSVSAAPYIRQVVDALAPTGSVECLAVRNTFFGESVTVAGLLTAHDMLKNITNASKRTRFDEIIIPNVVFNYAGHTLDGYSLNRIADRCTAPVRAVETIMEIFQ